MTPYYVVMRIGIAESVAYRPPIASTKVLGEANVDPALPPGRYAEKAERRMGTMEANMGTKAW